MTIGKDVSPLFSDVVKCSQTNNIELKKLVYLYIINYAKTQEDQAVMAVNTFVQVQFLDVSSLVVFSSSLYRHCFSCCCCCCCCCCCSTFLFHVVVSCFCCCFMILLSCCCFMSCHCCRVVGVVGLFVSDGCSYRAAVGMISCVRLSS